tara:strand:- start:75 stop:248 length:174 start_codon:yes stop_codon:yes gene_type:complete
MSKETKTIIIGIFFYIGVFTTLMWVMPSANNIFKDNWEIVGIVGSAIFYYFFVRKRN